MNENISRLMDGEVDAQEFDLFCADMKSPEAMNAWTCYHIIGDQLRGAHGMSAGFATRFRAALVAEPTILAPATSSQRRRTEHVATAAWAIAATLAAVTVVGWTAFSMVDAPPTAVAKAREAATVRAAQIKSELPADYLLAHQEYSPSTAIQSTGPYLRAVSVTGNEPRP